MPILPKNADYTDKDFDAIRARLRNMIPTVFPTWTDEDTANFGNLLVELYAWSADVLGKYQDNQAMEAFIATVTQRRNIIALAKLTGFRPRGQTASTVDLTLTISAPPTGTVTLPVGTVARTEQIVDPAKFQFLGSVEWLPGSGGSRTVTAENSEPRSETFTSSLRANQDFRLNGTPFLDASAIISDASGLWTEVQDFLSSTASSRDFVVLVDQDNRATIRFGNGVNGQIPNGTITVVYKVGGGIRGSRVEAGTIRKLEGVATDSFGNPVTITVSNTNASSLALDRQTTEQIRVMAPMQNRALTRSVSREDFEIHALEVAGVSRALMLTADQDDIVPENTGYLFIVPVGGGYPTTLLREQVLEAVTVTYPSTLTFRVEVLDVIYLDVNITAKVWLRAGVTPSTARASILAALAVAFAIEDQNGIATDGIDFGYNLRDANGDPAGSIAWSDVFNVIRDDSNVRKIDAGGDGLLINGARADLTIAVREFPRLGTVTLINGDTGLELV